MELTKAAEDVLAERQRQQKAEGWTEEHDDQHDIGELSKAAAAYARVASAGVVVGYATRNAPPPAYWPWAAKFWKPTTPRRDLVKAGALILAEIERLDRLTPNGEVRGASRLAGEASSAEDASLFMDDYWPGWYCSHLRCGFYRLAEEGSPAWCWLRHGIGAEGREAECPAYKQAVRLKMKTPNSNSTTPGDA